MNCDQARDVLLDRLDGEGQIQPTPDVDLHLRDCPACQTWYRQQQLAAAALEKLTPIRVSDDLTARIMAHLPNKKRRSEQRAAPERRASGPTSLRQAWQEFVDSLGRPAGRRRLAPALMAVAAVLVVAICVFAIAQGARVPVTPGAATGSPPWLLLAGGVVVVLLAVVGTILLRRK